MRRNIALAALLTALALPVVARAQAYRVYGGEQFFTLDWATETSRGRPVISGYVVNRYGIAAQRMRLLVESLDADGKVLDTTIGYVPGDVPAGSRAYFEVRLPGAAPTYRVSVLSWDWKKGHGS